MARLNEPPMSTDSVETLRRKFLRQNRDIARVNSAQSLRIRSLEGECGRLLSDNLTLEGRVLELERELDDARAAQRVADHALDIKARMEAQLAEWGAMVQALGVEPPAKRQARLSPAAARRARPRRSDFASPAARQRPRDARSAERAAAQDGGRLPPIQENKSYPRRTMSHAELVAVCAQRDESNESPDLGPPPTSRFVEDDPVKIDSPSRSTGELLSSPRIKGEVLLLPDALQQPKLEPKKRSVSAPMAFATQEPNPTKALDVPARQLLKAGSKRKFGDETNDNQTAKGSEDKVKEVASSPPEKPVAAKDVKYRRSGKDMGSRRDQSDTASTDRPQRRPLAEKSKNDDLVSPTKSIHSATTDDITKPQLPSNRAVAPLKKKRPVPIKLPIPSLPPPSTAIMTQEPATPSADPAQLFSHSPETRPAQQDTRDTRDTPPPTDISVHGETSRPSRRARPAISYAEPSLRDKMRRPTKELLDAVKGEGKYVRSSAAHLLGPPSSAKTDQEEESARAAPPKRTQEAEGPMAHEATRRPAVVSPLLQRDPIKEQQQPKSHLPASVVTARRKRPSSRPSQLFEPREEDEASQEKEEEEKEDDEVDPYEFHSLSPALAEQQQQQHQPKEQPPYTVGRITKGMSRSMAAAGSAGDEAAAAAAAGGGKKPGRKRASMMAAPKKRLLLVDASSADDDSSYEAGGEAAAALREKISRRRSMML